MCRLAGSGQQVVLATARFPAAVDAIVRQFDFAPWLICFSGAWISHCKSWQGTEVLLDKRIPYDSACSILTIADSQGLEPNVFTPQTWRVRKTTSEVLEESRIVNVEPSVVPELLKFGEEPSKILLIGTSGALARVRNSIREISSPTFSKENYLEILPSGANKGKALETLADLLGISLMQMAAIGDGQNDLEMLRAVGVAIVMGNASEELKRFATWVVSTNDESGVAEAVQRLIGNPGSLRRSCDI